MPSAVQNNYPGAAQIGSVMIDTGISCEDITNIVDNVNIHSDMEITSSFAEIAIVDMGNWMEYLQIGAGDLVTLTILHGEDESYEYRWRINAIVDFSNYENGRRYILNCISDLEYISLHTKMSRSFKGLPSEIAAAIVDQYSGSAVDVWENSTQAVNFIAPKWSPIKICKHMAKMSATEAGMERMWFFQDSKQNWNFTSLKNLREHSPEPITFTYAQNTLSENGIPDRQKLIQAIQKVSFLDAMNIAEALDYGTIKNTFQFVDPTTKTIRYQTNDQWDTYSSNIINKSLMWKEDEINDGNIIYRVDPSEGHINPYIPKDQASDDFTFQQGQQLEISIFGTPFVEIGDILNIEIPNMQPEGEGKKYRLDNYWSGKYYVTAKRDIIDKSGHATVLRLAKDSLEL